MAFLEPGSRWRSTSCTTEVVVVKAPADDIALECGGRPMVPVAPDVEVEGSPLDGLADGTLLGKRYADGGEMLELLCTKAGDGTLAVDGSALEEKGAKALPASD